MINTIIPHTFNVATGTVSNGEDKFDCIHIEFVKDSLAQRFIVSPLNALEIIEMLSNAVKEIYENASKSDS